MLGVGLVVLLMVTLGDGKHANRLDAIKTAGTIVVGTVAPGCIGAGQTAYSVNWPQAWNPSRR